MNEYGDNERFSVEVVRDAKLGGEPSTLLIGVNEEGLSTLTSVLLNTRTIKSGSVFIGSAEWGSNYFTQEQVYADSFSVQQLGIRRWTDSEWAAFRWTGVHKPDSPKFIEMAFESLAERSQCHGEIWLSDRTIGEIVAELATLKEKRQEIQVAMVPHDGCLRVDDDWVVRGVSALSVRFVD